jgi:hypothetical protein
MNNSERTKKEPLFEKITKEERLKNQDQRMEEEAALKGKALGCWCHPLRCHGDILQRMADESP